MDELLLQSELNALLEGLKSDSPPNENEEDTCIKDNTGDLITKGSIDELLGNTKTIIPKNMVSQWDETSITSGDGNKSLTQDEIDALLREFNLDI